jgi:hypothetical protein
MSAGGEECVLGQVTGPVATVGESNAPPPLPPAEEEGGAVDSRGAQSKSSWTLHRKDITSEEAGLRGPAQLRPEMMLSTVRGSRAPVLEFGKTRLLSSLAPREVPERGQWHVPEGRYEQGQEQTDTCRQRESEGQRSGSKQCGWAILSQRKEFMGWCRSGMSSAPSAPPDDQDLWITTVCGQRGRLIVEAGRSAESLHVKTPPTVGLRLPRPNTSDMARLGEELAAQRDPVGCISDRFHGPAALSGQTALATILSGVAARWPR